MNRFKQFYLLPCLLFTFFVGFLLQDKYAFAYTAEENFYPINLENASIALRDISNTNVYQEFSSPDSNGIYHISNPDIQDIAYIYFWDSSDAPIFTFPFNAAVYDYYVLGAVVADCNHNNIEKSTFKPTTVQVTGYDVSNQAAEHYKVSGLNVYDIDTHNKLGFGFYEKVDFTDSDNAGIRSIVMLNDQNEVGNKPANLQLQFAVMAVDKGESQAVALRQILTQLEDMEESLNNNITSGTSKIKEALARVEKTIEEQYSMEESEDFGVGDIQNEVEDKLGVLNFAGDTLTGFLDIFSESNAGDTTLTFPAFKIKVQGVEYKVWDNIEYDLSELEDSFGVLINSVRTITVLCVWLAVLSYLVKAYDQLINNRG